MIRALLGWTLPLLLTVGLAERDAARLGGIRHEYQRLNNCGPVTIGMAMSYWGSKLNQYQSAPVLKPNKADKNVAPGEMVAYARTQGFAVHQGVAGDLDLLKRLLAAGYPVIAQTWFVSDQGGMGHYRLLNGYQESGSFFRVFDSYNGPATRLGFAELDGLWQVYNRTYLLVYPPNRQAAVRELLGERATPGWEDRQAKAVALMETQRQPANGFAWFNLGTSVLKLGDTAAAARAFDRARVLPVKRSYDPDRPRQVSGNWPWRMLWYQFGPLEAYYRLGRHQEVITLTSENLRRVSDLEESYFWRGRARAALGQTRLAIGDFEAALRYKPGYAEARTELNRLRVKAAR